MTTKLKCPFCGKKLFYDEQDGIYRCMKFACVMDYEGGTEQLWQALIQAKQDLEITRKALGFYADSRFGEKQDDGTYALKIDKGCGVTVVYTYDPRLAKQTLEQIEHKE